MATLIAAIGEGKGTWTTVFNLAKEPEWEKVILIGPTFVKERLTLTPTMTFIEIDDKQNIKTMSATIEKALGPLFGEVGLNLTSGNGNQHMAIISAILKTGGGIRLVTYTNKVEEV